MERDSLLLTLVFQIEYKLNSMQMKFLRLLSKSAFQELNYSCTDSSNGQAGCVVDLKGENDLVVNNLDKINLTEVRKHRIYNAPNYGPNVFQ